MEIYEYLAEVMNQSRRNKRANKRFRSTTHKLHRERDTSYTTPELNFLHHHQARAPSEEDEETRRTRTVQYHINIKTK
jgi:hypothetical protein